MPRLSVPYCVCGSGIAHHHSGITMYESTTTVRATAIVASANPKIELSTIQPKSFHVCGSALTVRTRERSLGGRYTPGIGLPRIQPASRRSIVAIPRNVYAVATQTNRPMISTSSPIVSANPVIHTTSSMMLTQKTASR
jgi:hypothetical protein